MQSKLVSHNPRSWVLVLASGEEAKEKITAFAKKRKFVRRIFCCAWRLRARGGGLFRLG